MKMKSITQSEWNGYQRAIQAMPSQNDDFNLRAFGITLTRYWEIHQACLDARGMEMRQATLPEARRAIRR